MQQTYPGTLRETALPRRAMDRNRAMYIVAAILGAVLLAAVVYSVVTARRTVDTRGIFRDRPIVTQPARDLGTRSRGAPYRPGGMERTPSPTNAP